MRTLKLAACSFFLLGFICTSHAIAADDQVCATFQDCRTLLGQVAANIKEFQNVPAKWGRVLWTTNQWTGDLWTTNLQLSRGLSQFDASEACAYLGGRLPTARELAVNAVQCQRGKGANAHLGLPNVDGIALVEVADYDAGKIPYGFEKNDDAHDIQNFKLIETLEQDGTVDRFYFGSNNWRFSTDGGGYGLLSSSITPTEPGWAWAFHVSIAAAPRYLGDVTANAICIPSPLLKIPTQPKPEICGTLADCQDLSAKIAATMGKIKVNSSKKLGDFAKGLDGNPVPDLDQKAAIDQCTKLGTRLPTIRESITDLVQSLKDAGPNGGAFIVEIDDYNAGNIPPGSIKKDMALIEAKNPDGNIDRFYFGYRGWPPVLDGDKSNPANYMAWTSSISPTNSSMAWLSSAAMVDATSKGAFTSVRCMIR